MRDSLKNDMFVVAKQKTRCGREKVYDVLSVEKGWYRIVDDSGEDYLYPPDQFQVVSP